jgi:hypothetical protein
MITKFDIDGSNFFINTHPLIQQQFFSALSQKTSTNSNYLFMTLDDWLDGADLGCFKFLETVINLDWLEAQQKCEEIGGYLAEPRTFRSEHTT